MTFECKGRAGFINRGKKEGRDGRIERERKRSHIIDMLSVLEGRKNGMLAKITFCFIVE